MGRIAWTDEIAALAVSLPFSEASIGALDADTIARLHTLILDLQLDTAAMTPQLTARLAELLPLVEAQRESLSA